LDDDIEIKSSIEENKISKNETIRELIEVDLGDGCKLNVAHRSRPHPAVRPLHPNDRANKAMSAKFRL
jgi:hypothetical protein